MMVATSFFFIFLYLFFNQKLLKLFHFDNFFFHIYIYLHFCLKNLVGYFYTLVTTTRLWFSLWKRTNQPPLADFGGLELSVCVSLFVFVICFNFLMELLYSLISFRKYYFM